MIRIYAVAMVIGSGVALVMAALYSLPTALMVLRQSAGHAIEGLQRSDALLAIDGFVAPALQLLLLVAFATAFVRTHPSWLTWLRAKPNLPDAT